MTTCLRYVWPWAKEDMVSHDSYLCHLYPGPERRAFPTQRQNEDSNFVGAPLGDGGLWTVCPERCRPAEHTDWTHC